MHNSFLSFIWIILHGLFAQTFPFPGPGLPPSGGVTTQGISFRGSSGYVTDPANTTYSLGESYPTTRGGQTFGWSVNNLGACQDQTTSQNARLAGTCYQPPGGTSTFRWDVSAGTHNVCIGMGDFSGGYTEQAYFYDNATVRDNTTINGVPTTGAANYVAGNGTVYSAVNWASTGITQCMSLNISSGILNVVIGNAGSYNQINWLGVQ